MGISIKDLLTLEYFKEFYVVAGRTGIHKEVQGVTVVDAPDAYRWAKGKELVLTSGFVLVQDPDTIPRAFREGTIQSSSGLMIKRGRHIDRISDELKSLFDKYEIPLISMPFEIPYMEVMNEINIAIMNRTVQRFKITGSDMGDFSDQTYKEQKISRILRAVETDMNFPACLYDLSEEKAYYSSPHFMQITKSLNMVETDYWNPQQAYTKYTLCDVINMSRFRLFNADGFDGPRMSWILIPIASNDNVQAYFIIMESREFIDHYDEYAIRIAYLLLQALYEEIMITQNRGNIGFENFIQYMINLEHPDTEKISYQAGAQGISITKPYYYVMFRQNHTEQTARNERYPMLRKIRQSFDTGQVKLVFLSENEGMLAVAVKDDEANALDKIKKQLKTIDGQFKMAFPKMEFTYGFLEKPDHILNIRDHVDKLHHLMDMGPVIYPEKTIWNESLLGPLLWLQIPPEDLEDMLLVYKDFLEEEKNRELLKTLKIYLENNMNYSITADIMYVHVNTIRKRLNKLEQMLPFVIDTPMERMKQLILLQFLQL